MEEALKVRNSPRVGLRKHSADCAEEKNVRSTKKDFLSMSLK